MAILEEKKTGIIDNFKQKVESITKKKENTDKVKKSFVKDYIEELKDVDWPTKKQIFTWFFTTIIICVALTSFILSFDNVYKAGFKFVQCTSPKGTNLQLSQCLSELPKNIFQSNL